LYEVAFSSEGVETNFTFMRLMKVLKVMRTLRTVRVLRVFRELRLMIESMFSSMRSLFWACIMIALVNYIFGACFAQAMAIHLSEMGDDELAMKSQEIIMYWGSVARSMDTLYMCSTSGESWRFPSAYLHSFSPWLYGVFLIYISFFLFVVVNTLTSIILEAVMSNAWKNKQENVAHEMRKRDVYVKQFEALYMKLNMDEPGSLSFAELEKKFADPKMVAFMHALEIEVSDVEQFFSSLATNGTDAVDLQSFVDGCMRLKGVARSLDLACLANAHTNLCKRQTDFEKRLWHELSKVSKTSTVIVDALNDLTDRITSLDRASSVLPL